MQSCVYHMVNKSKPSMYAPGVVETWGNHDVRGIEWPLDPSDPEHYLPSYTIARPALYREYYWLKDFINFFIHNGGIEAIVRRFDSDKPLTGEVLSLVLKPVSHFHKHLTLEGKLVFEPVRTRTLVYIRALNLAELPSRE